MIVRSVLYVFIVASIGFILTGCASRELTPEDWQDPSIGISWPEAPEPSRIKFLRTIASREDMDEENSGSKILEWLLGENVDEQPLISPYGLAADGEGRIWVADPGSGLVKVFDLRDRKVSYLSGFGDRFMVTPVDVGFDRGQRKVYISDSGLNKILVFDNDGKYLSEITPPDGFGRPAGLTVAGDGSLYVVDVVNGVVVLFDSFGNYLREIGSVASEDGLFRHPSNVAVDNQGRLYVVDSLRFRVEIQANDGSLIRTIGQVGDGPGSFARPRGIAVDSSGHIYVADAAFDNIQIFDLAGQLLMYYGSPGSDPGHFCLPAGLFIDQSDRIYVAEACNHRVQVFQYVERGLE